MKCAICLSILLALFAITTASAGPPPQTKEPRPRFTPSQGGKPGRIDMVQYYAMPDPKAAAALLLEEAQLAGKDVDQTRPLPAHDGLGFRSSSVIIRPDPADDSFVQAVEAKLAQGAERDTMCVIAWTRRFPSIREIAEMMTLGVKIANDGGMGRFIARVPLASVPAVAAIAPVVWIGAYRPEYKYDANWTFVRDRIVSVGSFRGDQPGFREDLVRRGARILYGDRDGYAVHIDPDSIPRVAELPWVREIGQMPPTEVH